MFSDNNTSCKSTLNSVTNNIKEVGKDLMINLHEIICIKQTESQNKQIDEWWNKVTELWNNYINEINSWNREVLNVYHKREISADFTEDIMMKPLENLSINTKHAIIMVIENNTISKDMQRMIVEAIYDKIPLLLFQIENRLQLNVIIRKDLLKSNLDEDSSESSVEIDEEAIKEMMPPPITWNKLSIRELDFK